MERLPKGNFGSLSRAEAAQTSDLLTDTQLSDQSTIAFDVLLCQIVQQLTALTDHLQQAAAAVVVVLMHLQVLGQLLDASGQDRDLDFRRASVVFVGLVCLDNGRFLFFADHGKLHLSYISRPQG